MGAVASVLTAVGSGFLTIAIPFFTLVIVLCVIAIAAEYRHQQSYSWLMHVVIYGALFTSAASVAALL